MLGDRESTKSPDWTATWCVVAVLAACFLLELRFPIEPAHGSTPSPSTLLGMGGLDVRRTMSGEWFRLVSCTFLHASPGHLIGNAIAIAVGGFVVERMVGARWFLVLYAVGCMTSSVCSLAMSRGTFSVGASGASFALFGAGMFVAQLAPPEMRRTMRFQIVFVLVSTVLVIDPTVDYGAHLGGLIGGGLVGLLFFHVLRREEPHRQRRGAFRRSRVALVLLVPFALAVPWTIRGVAQAYPRERERIAVRNSLAPSIEDNLSSEQVQQLVEAYPDDPRVMQVAAEHAGVDGDWPAFDRAVAHGREVLPRTATAFDKAGMETLHQRFAELDREGVRRRRLMGNRQLPTGSHDEVEAWWLAHLDENIARYPDDPRLRARAMWRAPRDEAEVHLERGQAALDELGDLLTSPDRLRAEFQLKRAYFLMADLRMEEARALFAEVCAGTTPSAESARHAGWCP